MERYPLYLTEGEMIVLKRLVKRAQEAQRNPHFIENEVARSPKQTRALNTLASKVKTAQKERT